MSLRLGESLVFSQKAMAVFKKTFKLMVGYRTRRIVVSSKFKCVQAS